MFDALLAGYYGFGNFGDELLASRAVDCLVSCGVERNRIAILSGNPAMSERALGIKAFDRGAGSRGMFAAISSSRCVIFAGGGIFQDASSLASCLYYWAVIRIALAMRRPVCAVAQSVGPLGSRAARLFARDALKRCSYFSVRDDASRALSATLGLDPPMTPDLVMGFSIPRIGGRQGIGTVLFNVRPCSDKRIAARAVGAARACSAGGCKIRGVAFADGDMAEIRNFISLGELPECETVLVKDLRDFIDASEDASAAIGMRLHFGILSKLRGLGVFMSPYDPKVECFTNRFADICPDFNEITVNDIIKLLTKSLFEDKRKIDADEAGRASAEDFKAALRACSGGC
ncbi:polysaccharide pyruvyl transferase CsaB [Synergistales bacterium]|nr:polysaccharide pyruvyl transferase CsaB [Synergistales bacterium]